MAAHGRSGLHDGAMGIIMPNGTSARIHPTAVISPEAELADDVEIGPYAVIEGKVRVGPGCVLRPHAVLIGPLTMGRATSSSPGPSSANGRSTPGTRTSRPAW